MSRSFLRQSTQVSASTNFDDALTSGISLQSSSYTLEGDLNSIRSQIKRTLYSTGTGNWYDALPGSARGIKQLDSDLTDIEVKKLIYRVQKNTVGLVVPTGQNYVTLSVGSGFAPNYVAAITSAATGTIAASLSGSDWNVHSMVLQSGSSVLAPKNLVLIVSASTGNQIQASTGEDIYALMQVSGTVSDGDVFDDALLGVQFSFVQANPTRTGLISASITDIQNKKIQYSYPRRIIFDEIPDDAYLNSIFVDTIAPAPTVNLQERADAVVTTTIISGTNVTYPTNLDAPLLDYSSYVSSYFVSGVLIYVNGQLQRNGVDVLASYDVYPGTNQATGDLKFNFSLFQNDVVTMVIGTNGLVGPTGSIGPSGSAGPSINSYSDLAALKAAGDVFSTGQLVYVVSRGAYYSWNSTNTLTANDLDIVQITSVTTGRMMRQLIVNPDFQKVTNWYLDYASGSDDATGLVGAPLKTCRELNLRLCGVASVAYNVNVLSDLNASDPLMLVANFSLDYIANSSSTSTLIRIVGTKTAIRSGTISAVTAPVVATNTPGAITDVSASWATSITNKYRIDLTSGVSSGKIMWPCKDNGSGSVRVNLPYTIGGTVGTFPSVNDTYTEYSLTTGKVSVTGNGSYVIEDWNMATSANQLFMTTNQTTGMRGCVIGNIQAFFSPNISMTACRDGVSTALQHTLPLKMTITGCTFMLGTYSIRNGGVSALTTCLFQGVGLSTTSTTTNTPGVVSLINCGFMDMSGTPVLIERGTICKIETALWGSGNTTGTKVDSGGKIIVATGITPTLAGTTELSIAGVTNLLPPLEAYAGLLLPATSACTTWAQWAASPFNRSVYSYQAQAGITSI